VKTQTRKAVLKETISAVQAAIKAGVDAGEITDNTTTRAYLKEHLNYTKFQNTKCTVRFSYNTSDCFTFANGSTLDIPAYYNYDFVFIDADGNNGPNTPGEDLITMNWNFTQETKYVGGARNNTHTPRPGELVPSWKAPYYGTAKGDVELYQELFQ
jgi:hypothetical protein